jgi:hypothetical protein
VDDLDSSGRRLPSMFAPGARDSLAVDGTFFFEASTNAAGKVGAT